MNREVPRESTLIPTNFNSSSSKSLFLMNYAKKMVTTITVKNKQKISEEQQRLKPLLQIPYSKFSHNRSIGSGAL